jgi:hypothetical protein
MEVSQTVDELLQEFALKNEEQLRQFTLAINKDGKHKARRSCPPS